MASTLCNYQQEWTLDTNSSEERSSYKLKTPIGQFIYWEGFNLHITRTVYIGNMIVVITIVTICSEISSHNEHPLSCKTFGQVLGNWLSASILMGAIFLY